MREGRKVADLAENRDSMFFTNWTCLSNIFDARYRGQSLGAERLRLTLEFFPAAWKLLMGDAATPDVQEVTDFLALQGRFRCANTFISASSRPSAFWSLYKDTNLGVFASLVSCLPASAACRVPFLLRSGHQFLVFFLTETMICPPPPPGP